MWYAIPVFGTPTVSDGCDPNPTINDIDITATNNADGTVLTFEAFANAADASGNISATCSQTIIGLHVKDVL